MANFFSNWLNLDSSDKKANARVYNTFSESSSSPQPFPSSISSTNNKVGIEIFETYNTSNSSIFPILTSSTGISTELQSFGNSSVDSFKSCNRCRKLYKEEENNEWACKYHRGKFKESPTFTSIATLKRWTCCYQEVEHSEGCTAGTHEEDHRVTGILNSFAMAVSKDSELPTTPQQKKEVKNLIKENKREKRKGEVQYAVQKDDTLQKLALQYNVSIGAIKKANKLFTDQIFGKKVIIIPPEVDS